MLDVSTYANEGKAQYEEKKIQKKEKICANMFKTSHFVRKYVSILFNQLLLSDEKLRHFS